MCETELLCFYFTCSTKLELSGFLINAAEKKGEWAMNINKFTQKSMEAVQNCEKLAYEYGNQQIDEQHLLYSLLTLEDSLILKLVSVFI